MNIHDIYSRVFAHFRPQRVRLLYDAFGITERTRVLDVGGTPYFWNLAQSLGMPVPQLTLANIDCGVQTLPVLVNRIIADGRKLPFKDNHFDLVFSNSVIEHLGGWQSQMRFAAEIRRVTSNYFVQTPDKRFPVEPHLLTPFVHWLPSTIQGRALRNFTVWGVLVRPSVEDCRKFMNEICLLDGQEMHSLFPDASIKTERLLGLSKSIIAIRKAT